MMQFEYNVIPWCDTPPSKPGLYLAVDREDNVILVSVYPEKGYLMVQWGVSFIGIGHALKFIKQWSPRIAWAEITP
jgi:hypothetical protein